MILRSNCRIKFKNLDETNPVRMRRIWKLSCKVRESPRPQAHDTAPSRVPRRFSSRDHPVGPTPLRNEGQTFQQCLEPRWFVTIQLWAIVQYGKCGRGFMIILAATVWLFCTAIFLELADRAPTLEYWDFNTAPITNRIPLKLNLNDGYKFIIYYRPYDIKTNK